MHDLEIERQEDGEPDHHALRERGADRAHAHHRIGEHQAAAGTARTPASDRQVNSTDSTAEATTSAAIGGESQG